MSQPELPPESSPDWAKPQTVRKALAALGFPLSLPGIAWPKGAISPALIDEVCKGATVDSSRSAKARRLKVLQAIEGINDAKMAKALGVNRSTYSRMLSGKRLLTDDTLEAVAKLYGASFTWLRDGLVFDAAEHSGYRYTVRDDLPEAVAACARSVLVCLKVLGLYVGPEGLCPPVGVVRRYILDLARDYDEPGDGGSDERSAGREIEYLPGAVTIFKHVWPHYEELAATETTPVKLTFQRDDFYRLVAALSIYSADKGPGRQAARQAMAIIRRAAKGVIEV